jgi:prepilin-type N-terminal cleavage/methylation domain-containing protein
MKISKTNFHQRGFTMIEMIVVLIVMAIFASIVISRYTSVANGSMTEMDGLKASLRYAQIQAMNDTVSWGIHFSADGTSYVLYKDGIPAVIGGIPVMIPVKIPDSLPNNTHMLQGNVKITMGAGTTVTYDKLGSPGAVLITIELSQGVNKNRIAITPETGFVYVP